VSSTWKLVKRQEIAADTPSSAPAPSSAQPAASPAPSAPSPTSSKDPPPPAPGPVIAAPSTVLEPYVNVIVSSFGGDESCSPQKIVFEYGLSNGMITPAQTEVDARDSLKTLGVSLPLSTGDGIYSIYAYSLCSSGSKRTDRSNGLSVSVNTPAPLFYLSSNGVTVQCPAAPIGSVGIVNGITYTKRDLNQILSLVSQQQYDEIERTCTSGITSLNAVFKNAATFNGNIGTWDVSSVVSMRETFYNAASFNQDIRFWDTRSVTSLSDTFRGASQFNQPLTTNGSQWYTGLVTNMQRTFKDAVVFNQDISSWDTTSVTSLQGMFNGASSFNKPLATNGKQWNTSSVTNMHNLFYYATSFNQDISSWETQRVTDMHGVFHFAQSFNQPLPRDGNKWNTDAVTTMRWMFSHAISFDQDISGWIVSAVTDCYRYDRDASASWTVAEKPTFSVSCT
jgi:surface protein